ncbi:unnamed protein product [Ectocarpus sp. 12 AP-2014]
MPRPLPEGAPRVSRGLVSRDPGSPWLVRPRDSSTVGQQVTTMTRGSGPSTRGLGRTTPTRGRKNMAVGHITTPIPHERRLIIHNRLLTPREVRQVALKRGGVDFPCHRRRRRRILELVPTRQPFSLWTAYPTMIWRTCCSLGTTAGTTLAATARCKKRATRETTGGTLPRACRRQHRGMVVCLYPRRPHRRTTGGAAEEEVVKGGVASGRVGTNNNHSSSNSSSSSDNNTAVAAIPLLPHHQVLNRRYRGGGAADVRSRAFSFPRHGLFGFGERRTRWGMGRKAYAHCTLM